MTEFFQVGNLGLGPLDWIFRECLSWEAGKDSLDGDHCDRMLPRSCSGKPHEGPQKMAGP